MFQGKRIGAALLMGGEGRRFGSPLPKQFLPLGGAPLFLYPLKTLLQVPSIDELLLVVHPSWLETAKEALSGLPPISLIPGGETRQLSTYAALCGFRQTPDVILLHDAARPFVSREIVESAIATAVEKGAADTCIPSPDTLVFAPDGAQIEEIPLRAHYWRGQTPQAFWTSWLSQAHEEALARGEREASDDCTLVLKSGKPISLVRGSEKNFKITTPFDLTMAEALLTFPCDFS